MKIQHIIDWLESRAPWVNYHKTRDIVYCGDTDKDVNTVGVCWVATRRALQQAANFSIHFIISHENFLYEESTNPYEGIREARKWKLDFCKEHDITVYRCHDNWDCFPDYGISDSYAKAIDLPFGKRIGAYYHFADVKMTAKEAAQKVADGLKPYGCDGVEILGNPDKQVHRIAIGTGAVSRFDFMHGNGADCMVLADDGSNNWIEFQWCLDNEIPVIICHHSVNEIPGMAVMADYLASQLYEVSFVKLDEGYRFTTVKGR